MQGSAQNITNLINLREHGCWRGAPKDLEFLTDRLSKVDQVTESSFLELGGKIKLFHDQARGISSSAGEVLHLLHGHDGENTLQHLQLLVERCSLWITETGEESTEICTLLGHVVEQISCLEEPVKGLRKVIKTLHSLRVSTRIEAAKGYTSGAGVLAKSLDQLGSLIQNKVSEISECSEALLPVIKQSLVMEEIAQSGSIRTARSEINKARGLLAAYMGNCLETEHWTGRLKERSVDVAQNFGEMISALQFQDITRQRLDHVQKALTNLSHHLDQFNRRTDFSHDAEASRLFGRICLLQHRQVKLAHKEFLLAADNLSENLNGMASSVVSMSADTRELALAAGAGTDNHFVAVPEILKTIADYLDVTSKIHHSAGDHLGVVCQGIQKVTDLVEEIKLIGEEVQLLAMNAAVSAAHARQQGASLDIIAQNIHAVAEEATAYSLILANECEKVTSYASHLQEMERETNNGSENVNQLLKDARERMAKIETNCAKLMTLTNEVDQSASSLSGQVGAIINSIDVRVSFDQELAPVLGRLKTLSADAEEDVPVTEDDTLETLFGGLELCYTMDSERRVHRQFVEGQDPKQTELNLKEDEWSANRDHGLGDNVDLF